MPWPAKFLNVWPSRPNSDNSDFVLGFGHGRALGDGVSNTFVAVPYWYIILIFFGLLFFVWRKTRPKINPATAFPVELTAKNVQK